MGFQRLSRRMREVISEAVDEGVRREIIRRDENGGIMRGPEWKRRIVPGESHMP